MRDQILTYAEAQWLCQMDALRTILFKRAYEQSNYADPMRSPWGGVFDPKPPTMYVIPVGEC